VASADVLAHMLRVIHFSFVVKKPDQQAAGGGMLAPIRGCGALSRGGGHAMLLANPHLPWEDFYSWFEAQLTAPGVDAYGATLVGLPILRSHSTTISAGRTR
jgi:acyl-homoserine-lactone acylase